MFKSRTARSVAISVLLSSCAYGPQTQQAETFGTAAVDADRVTQYGAAWAARDVDAILAQHTDDSVFHLVVAGSRPASGKDALRPAFGAIFESNPEYASTVTNMQFGDDFVVIDYTIDMDGVRSARAGACTFTPQGSRYAAPAIDVITFRDGLVARKVTYLDTEIIRANSASVECS